MSEKFEAIRHGDFTKNKVLNSRTLEFFDKKTGINNITKSELKRSKRDNKNFKKQENKYMEELKNAILKNKQFNPLSEKELESATIYDLKENGSDISNPEHDQYFKSAIENNKTNKQELEFTQEDQINYDRLEKEISELKIEIQNLENEKLNIENSESGSKKETPNNTPESIELATESMSIEEYKENLHHVMKSKFSETFENHGLEYENIFVSGTEDEIHTDIKFRGGFTHNGYVSLKFDLKSKKDIAILQNSEWVKNHWWIKKKLQKIGLPIPNMFDKQSANDWSAQIIKEFVETQTKDKNLHKMDIKNGRLTIEHKT